MNQLEKFLKSPACQNARVQVKLPQGEFHSPDGYFDVHSITLMENNISLWVLQKTKMQSEYLPYIVGI